MVHRLPPASAAAQPLGADGKNLLPRLCRHCDVGKWARMAVVHIATPSMQDAFALYARHQGGASIRRCWSTWNLLRDFLWLNMRLAVNPMPSIDRPQLTAPVPWSAVQQFGEVTAPT
jgi:hypothetical protein